MTDTNRCAVGGENMICQKCGTNVADGTVICPTCGNALPTQNPYGQPQQNTYAQPQQNTYAQPQPYGYQQAPVMTSVSPTSVLVMGIIAIALAWEPFASIAGIVLGAIAMTKANRYYAEGGLQSGKVKTGKILGTIGMIAGIVMTVFYLIALIVGIGTASLFL